MIIRYALIMDQWLQRMVDARKRRKISVADVARRLDLHRSAVYRWEAGERFPEIDLLRKWAEVVGVDVDLIVRDPADYAPETGWGLLASDAAGAEPSVALLAKVRQLLPKLDERTLRMLDAQFDALASVDVKKVL